MRSLVRALVLVCVAGAACGSPHGASSSATTGSAAATASATADSVTTTDTVRAGPIEVDSATLAARAAEEAGRRNPDRNRPADDRCRFARPLVRVAELGSRYDTLTMQHGIDIHCELRENGRPVRLVVSGDYAPTRVVVYASPAAREPLQRLSFENDEGAYEGNALVTGEDLDRDGWTDLLVETWGGSGGTMFEVFRYDPRRERFVRDTMLSGMGNIRPAEGARPCISYSWSTGADEGNGGNLCLVRGKWESDYEWEQKRLPDGRSQRVTKRWPGGRLQERTDTVKNSGEPWS